MAEIQTTMATVPGAYNDCFTPIIMERVSELGDIIKDSESNLKTSLHSNSIAFQKEICDTNKNISENGRDNMGATKDAACMLDKSINENRYFLHDNIKNAQAEVKEAKYQLAEKIDREFDVLKLKNDAFERQTAENFCTVRGEIKDNTRMVLDRLSSDKLDEKNDEIARLRAKQYHNEHHFALASIQQDNAYIKQLVNSISQEQRFSSKTVQFGTGNLAGTAQTANQG